MSFKRQIRDYPEKATLDDTDVMLLQSMANNAEIQKFSMSALANKIKGVATIVTILKNAILSTDEFLFKSPTTGEDCRVPFSLMRTEAIKRVIQTETGASAITLASVSDFLYISNTSLIASLVVTLPADPVTGKLYQIYCRNAVTSMTISGGTKSILNATGSSTSLSLGALVNGNVTNFLYTGTAWIKF